MSWYKDAATFKETCGYQVNGSWYPRVTRILQVKAKPALENFFREMDSYASAEEVKNRSAIEGTLIHEVAQKILLGGRPEIPVNIKPAIAGFEDLCEKRNIFAHPEFMERRIWSYRDKFAGTIDAMAVIDGKFGVMDIKTSTGFYPEYNLQTAAYVSALLEPEIKNALSLSQNVQTRWILRIDQHKICKTCGARLREKGGRSKIRNGRSRAVAPCPDDTHDWGEIEGDAELKEFPYFRDDIKAFLAAKTLWEWENSYWLRSIGYL
ncbi:MAG: hypothetical protein COU46_01290 [Candidatus Niyogibacteria bacterium CG10_big_fil_rev_8_21_14_0_10_42_19]|uniref:PD-(D/E)XK endonuclease-like domain-containing protein n=1 Tax=Candidatus Niyogibacteria bacterium CG10_big_fil_rev_8_21_14_0_10_42_19 TaxID=1974725 RepID=A0A2H0TG13_9BACT|nr:MAG: hypothetical protein COU46_01290 [Candidatus Niyogibacteria bacterium CG10_big_fil_rev_8_21_14_0_10_42_19]